MFYWLTKVLFPGLVSNFHSVSKCVIFSFGIYHAIRPVEHLVYLIASILLSYYSKLLLQ